MSYCGQLRGGIKMFGFEIPSTMSVYCAMNDFCLCQHGDVISRSITPRQNAMVQLDTQCAVPPTTKKAGQNKCAAKDGNEKRRSGGRRNKKNKKGKPKEMWGKDWTKIAPGLVQVGICRH